ncbi:DUF1778 domain-containing protein [Photorhabdus caribbeanensis]|uniref:type II toxin -antitoxin system TacA 1-like antitoxin n=1 Tax=Photorhabdus caribbeanensis TaxID=1004165 RepID=UPI001BD51CBB|nr:DUF1778 domain-containing protein [Photorhabdus caribbeanensis]MBS9423675.1 DUF1778 domain-containing protein [Photorhabdus caribbeanensis]
MAILANERITTRVSSETKRLIEQNMRIQLCQEDALAFVHALEKPIKVNERFLRAARRHKETMAAAIEMIKRVDAM